LDWASNHVGITSQPYHKAIEVLRNVLNRFELDVLDVGHQQALGRVHSNADVVRGALDELAAVRIDVAARARSVRNPKWMETGQRLGGDRVCIPVEQRELEQGQGKCFDEKGHEGELEAVGLRLQARAMG